MFIVSKTHHETANKDRAIRVVATNYKLNNYRDVFVLDEEAVEEPDDGAEGEREREREGHVLHALRLDHALLHVATYTHAAH